MDADRFDQLTRATIASRSRRGMLATLLGGQLGLLGLADAAAKKGKGKKGKKKKGRNSSPPPGAPSPACADGLKSGNETDVDCGGTCPRCATGKTCASRDDCASALCTGGACQACVAPADCGTDADETMCACRDKSATERVCTKIDARVVTTTCANCLAGEQCIPLPDGTVECVLPCGAR